MLLKGYLGLRSAPDTREIKQAANTLQNLLPRATPVTNGYPSDRIVNKTLPASHHHQQHHHDGGHHQPHHHHHHDVGQHHHDSEFKLLNDKEQQVPLDQQV